MNRIIPCLIAIAVSANVVAIDFVSAKPVWPKGLAETMNLSVRFNARFEAQAASKVILRATANCAYRAELNGEFSGYGPARGPKGYFRVDEWPLAVKPGANEISLEVAGYNCNSYYFIDQPSFVQAEIVVNGKVVAKTDANGDFVASPTERIRKVPRYSYQRCFTEAYRLGGEKSAPYAELEVRPAVKLLDRIAPYPDFSLNRSLKPISRAAVRVNPNKKIVDLGYLAPEKPIPGRKCFLRGELECDLLNDALYVDFLNRQPVKGDLDRIALTAGNSFVLDAGLNDCGFSGMTVEVRKPGRLIFTFDEIIGENGDVDGARMNCRNVVEWRFEKPGRYTVETFEPYVWRYANLLTHDGDFVIADPYIRAYKNPLAGRAKFRCSDAALEKIFAAAKETFVQNAVDVFTDCPSRERAGWLCDSFFIGRVNRLLTGTTDSERLFLQNYALPERFDDLPDGMVPMCYPGDHRNGNFIPNWSMWLVIEAEEYLKRSGDRAMIDALKPRFVALINYLKTFRNSDGLLEKLPRWVFVEWSRSNKLVQDVNYPSNMTWAEVLDVMDRLYSMPELAEEAKRVRETIRKQSWTGEWFCDNAIRQKNGELKRSGECTETCQYYAFFFKTATPKTYPKLWKTLVDEFGPSRLESDKLTLKRYPKIWPSNAFIGNYLRLECLAREGLSAKILEESKGFFLYMAERTGTLWEHDRTNASCDHGFASHAAVTLFRDVLGVSKIDYAVRQVTILPPDRLKLAWCEGDLPVSATEVIHIRWEIGADALPHLQVTLPNGWTQSAATADRPWVSVEEDMKVRSTVAKYDFQPGTPEGDAIAFWRDEKKTSGEFANFDEAKAGELGKDYKLEDPLTFIDGRKVTNRSEWAARRREILDLLEREEYGRMPPKPDANVVELVSEKLTEDRFILERRYRQYFRADKTGPVIDWVMFVPRYVNGKVPIMLHLNYRGNDYLAGGWRTNHYKIPIDVFAARGYAFMSAHYTQITCDLEKKGGRLRDGCHELWGWRDPKATDLTGALMAWAWGLCRGLDLAETIPELDAKRNVVIGSSRLGKAALIAGAYDERFTVVVPNQTGGGGVDLMKRNYGETSAMMHMSLPHWFCSKFWDYERDQTKQPFDQHLLLACVAPRALLLECYHKKWFDPRGEFLAAQAASPVWELLTGKGLGGGAKGLSEWPESYSDEAVIPPYGYARRTEMHGLSAYDWLWALKFADQVFGLNK